jgi:hypothetical protein
MEKPNLRHITALLLQIACTNTVNNDHFEWIYIIHKWQMAETVYRNGKESEMVYQKYFTVYNLEVPLSASDRIYRYRTKKLLASKPP